MNKTIFIENFDREAYFGIRIFYQVYRCLQQFLSILSNVSDMEDINFDLIDISHIHLSVIIQQRSCTLPTSSLGEKRQNDHIQHVPNTKSKNGYDGVIKNESTNIVSKLKSIMAHKEVFMESNLKYCSMFDKTRRFCRIWVSK